MLDDTPKLMQFIFACFALVFCVVFVSYAQTTSNFKHTAFEPGQVPGTIISERWSASYWFTLTMCLFYYLPFGMMMTLALGKTSRNVHYAHMSIVLIIMVHQAIGFFIWIGSYSHANDDKLFNMNNEFNGDRYCCAPEIQNIVGNNCVPLTTPCAPAVIRDQLDINPVALWKFWVNFIGVMICLVHMFVYIFSFLPSLTTKNNQNALLDDPDDDEERVPVYNGKRKQ